MKKLKTTLASIGLLLIGCILLLGALYSGLEGIWFIITTWGSGQFPKIFVLQSMMLGIIGFIFGTLGKLIYKNGVAIVRFLSELDWVFVFAVLWAMVLLIFGIFVGYFV